MAAALVSRYPESPKPQKDWTDSEMWPRTLSKLGQTWPGSGRHAVGVRPSSAGDPVGVWWGAVSRTLQGDLNAWGRRETGAIGGF